MVGNSSSKYDFKDRCLDADYVNKRLVQDEFTKDFVEFIKRDYKYHENDGSISLEQKKYLIINFFKEIGI